MWNPMLLKTESQLELIVLGEFMKAAWHALFAAQCQSKEQSQFIVCFSEEN